MTTSASRSPVGFDEWLQTKNDAGVTMLEARIAEFVEENDPDVAEMLFDDKLNYWASGGGPDGIYRIELTVKATGERVWWCDVHWTKPA